MESSNQSIQSIFCALSSHTVMTSSLSEGAGGGVEIGLPFRDASAVVAIFFPPCSGGTAGMLGSIIADAVCRMWRAYEGVKELNSLNRAAI